MTDNNHPITPPPELVEQWYETADNSSKDVIQEVAAQAARWGADQELEACCVWLRGNDPYEHDYHQMLRAVRRPKPPSLKEQAFELVDRIEKAESVWAMSELDIIRRALESLPD